MRQSLAILCGKLFIFFFNLCGQLEYDLAFGLLNAMHDASNGQARIDATQENYRKAFKEAGK